MPAIRFILLALIAASVAGCSASPVLQGDGGTSAGTPPVTGSIGAKPTATQGAPVVGPFVGNHIDAALDDEDRQRAYAAQIQALETGPSGAPVAWRNPDSGHYGNVVPGPAYQISGANCRQFTHTVTINGALQARHGTACRNADGTWTAVN